MDSLIKQYSRPSESLGADMNSAISNRQLTLPLSSQGAPAHKPSVFRTTETLKDVNVIREEGSLLRGGQVLTQKYTIPIGLRAPQGMQPSRMSLQVEYKFK
jgi:hypothetical protein